MCMYILYSFIFFKFLRWLIKFQLVKLTKSNHIIGWFKIKMTLIKSRGFKKFCCGILKLKVVIISILRQDWLVVVVVLVVWDSLLESYLALKSLLIVQFWQDSDQVVPVDQSMAVLSNGIKVGMNITIIRFFKLRKMIQINSMNWWIQ